MKHVFREAAIVLVLLCCGLSSNFASTADPSKVVEVESRMEKVDGIYFFGYDGLDLKKIKKSIKLKVGDEVDSMKFYRGGDIYFPDVKKITGKPVTDTCLVNIGHGKHIVFVGLPGKSNTDVDSYVQVGETRVQVPEEIEKTYNELMEELPQYLKTREESRKKHMRDLEVQLKEQARPKRAELRKSLLESKNTLDRGVAAFSLGLVAEDYADFDAVTRAAKDPSSLVRNNSTRELGVLLEEKPELVSMIREDSLAVYANMINSRTWTDRNKSVFMMLCLSKNRDPRVLSLLKKNSLASLKEMVLWPEGYAGPALTLLGRVGGLPDEQIEKLIAEKNSAAILDSIK